MQLFSTEETAKRLNLHPETVRRFIREGRLHAVKIGNVHRIEENEIAAYVERLPTNGVHRPEQGATDEGRALNDILALGARLTTNAAPLRDDAVRRSYGDDDAAQDEHAQDVRRAA